MSVVVGEMVEAVGTGGTATTGLTVVGIPTRNEAATVSTVARTADAGLALAGSDRPGVIVLADNGSTDGTVERFLETEVRARKVVVRSGAERTGKGTNVFALIDKAMELGASRLVLLDGDIRSAEPEWVGHLAYAVEGPAPTMAAPIYRRNRYEANSTNHLVCPLLGAMFGSALQQPIAGDFAFNRAFLQRVAAWPRPASASLYGIDVWLTANALREGHKVVEVPLGRKIHNSPFPKILFLPQQVLDALLHIAAATDRPRPASATLFAGVPRDAVDATSTRQDPQVVAWVSRSVKAYVGKHGSDIRELFPAAAGLSEAPWGLRVGLEDWPQLLADCLEGVAKGEFERSRDHLIALYVNRVMTFWDEIDGLGPQEIDSLLDRQTSETAHAVRERSIVFDTPQVPGAFDPGRWAEFQTAM
jgi:hypothetical protein